MSGQLLPATALHMILTSGARGAGEIIPQALCTRYGLQIGAYSAWFVRALMAVTSPLTFPISKILDWLLGTEHGVRTCLTNWGCCRGKRASTWFVHGLWRWCCR